MYSKWTSHLANEEDKEKFQRKIISAKSVLDRLADILKEEKLGLDYADCNYKTYETPNWDYKQAHANGHRGCLMAITKLIDLDQQKGIDQ